MDLKQNKVQIFKQEDSHNFFLDITGKLHFFAIG